MAKAPEVGQRYGGLGVGHDVARAECGGLADELARILVGQECDKRGDQEQEYHCRGRRRPQPVPFTAARA